MRLFHFVIVVLFCSMVFGACGSNNVPKESTNEISQDGGVSSGESSKTVQDGGAPKKDGVPKKDFGRLYQEAICKVIHDCCKGKTMEAYPAGIFGTDLESCKKTPYAKVTFGKLYDSPRLSYDPLEAKKCIDAYKKLSCSKNTKARAPNDCVWKTFVGQQKENDICNRDSECQKGLFCTENAGLEGKCQKYVGKDEVCDPHTKRCDPKAGIYCNTQEKKCKENLGEGEKCASHACKTGLMCIQGKCSTPPPTPGMCK